MIGAQDSSNNPSQDLRVVGRNSTLVSLPCCEPFATAHTVSVQSLRLPDDLGRRVIKVWTNLAVQDEVAWGYQEGQFTTNKHVIGQSLQDRRRVDTRYKTG
jgi:hypothetical protein